MATTVLLNRSPHAVRQARHEARGWLMSHPRAWVAEIEVEIVVSELVANAVLNGSEPIVLSLDERDGLIRISVSDGNPELPQENEDDDRMTFGLKIVRALAHRFGASRRGVDGKTTWAEF